MKNYLGLMQKIMTKGSKKNDTLSLFGESLEFDLRKGFPIVTTRKIFSNAAFAELACFVRGYTDVRKFREMGVKFWNDDCNKKSWSNSKHKKNEFDLGKIYGYQWRKGFGFDQLMRLVINLKINPLSRRHILTTFNPAHIDEGCLPPCYVSHQFYVDETGHLDMLVHQRSADFALGVTHDLVSFALFQHLMAKETGLKVRKLKVIFGDVHIYEPHFSGVHDQLKRKPLKLPKLVIQEDASLFSFMPGQIKLKDYDSHGLIKYPFVTQAL